MFRKRRTLGGRERLSFSITQIDDYVKHTFREHSQEAECLANMVQKGGGISLLKKKPKHKIAKGGARLFGTIAPRLMEDVVVVL